MLVDGYKISSGNLLVRLQPQCLDLYALTLALALSLTIGPPDYAIWITPLVLTPWLDSRIS